MKKILVMVALLLPIAACSQTERGAAIGGLGGAAIGAAVAGDPLQGAVLGGAIGAVGGALIGNASERGQCRYRDRRGHVYVDRCPSRYDGHRGYDRRYDQRRYYNNYGGY